MVRTGQGPPAARNRKAGYSPAFGPWRNSGAVNVVVEDRGLEAKPGLGAEFWESLAGVVAWQGDVAATAERELCAAEQSGMRNSGSGLRVCAGAAQRMARGTLKGNRADDHGAWVREGRLARITGETGSAREN